MLNIARARRVSLPQVESILNLVSTRFDKISKDHEALEDDETPPTNLKEMTDEQLNDVLYSTGQHYGKWRLMEAALEGMRKSLAIIDKPLVAVLMVRVYPHLTKDGQEQAVRSDITYMRLATLRVSVELLLGEVTGKEKAWGRTNENISRAVELRRKAQGGSGGRSW